MIIKYADKEEVRARIRTHGITTRRLFGTNRVPDQVGQFIAKETGIHLEMVRIGLILLDPISGEDYALVACRGPLAIFASYARVATIGPDDSSLRLIPEGRWLELEEQRRQKRMALRREACGLPAEK